MLEYLRNAADKPVAKILITILAFSFVGWGVAEWIFGGATRDTTLVRVGGTELSVQQFNAERSRELASMTRDEMRNIYADADAGAAFNNKVITRMTTQTMAQKRANNLGFVVSDTRIAYEIREMPEFQVGGKFSSLAFDSVLNASGYSEVEFANVLRAQVLRQMLLGVIGAPLKVPNFVADAAYNARYATRDIDYTAVKFADFAVGNPTEQDLREYYAANPQTVAEVRSASYILVPADMDKPDQADAAYETARKVEDDIIAGDAMRDVAVRHNARFVTLKPFSSAADISDEVLNTGMIAKLFDMANGEESELIETKKGFVIMRMDNVAPSHIAEFESVKNNLNSDWTRDAQRKKAYLRANDILVDVKDGKPMANKVSANVSRANGAPMAVLAAAFNTPVGTSALVPTNDAFYVITVRDAAMPKADATRAAALRSELGKTTATELSDDYNSFLMREYPVKLNENVYRRFVSQQ